MEKSPDAFRTISEVADHLGTPAHVLRFWESRFPQIRPVKRAGGRRYYRPSDIALLTGIKRLLHDEGLTIRGVQKILREQGVRHVTGLSADQVPIGDPVAVPDEPPDLAVIIAETVVEAPVAPRPPAPEPSGLPLFDAPAQRPAEPRDDVGFASRIRALPPEAFGKTAPTVAGLARRLAALRTRMGDRAAGGRG